MCPWYPKCFGGCTKDRVKDPEDNHQPRFCAGYQLFLEHADTKLKNIALGWTQQQADLNEHTKSRGVYNAFDDLVKNKK